MCAAIVYMDQYHSHLPFNVLMSRIKLCSYTCTQFVSHLLSFYFVVYDVIINNEVRDVGILMLWKMNQIGVAYNVDSTE